MNHIELEPLALLGAGSKAYTLHQVIPMHRGQQAGLFKINFLDLAFVSKSLEENHQIKFILKRKFIKSKPA